MPDLLSQRTKQHTSDIVQNILDAQKQVVSACWSCRNCGFLMEGTNKEDNSMIPLNFLEYSGTRQLAEDLRRFSDLIYSKKLSLYGILYGTNVMGTFATIFPSHVDKFVINSNIMYVTITEIDHILRENFILFSYAYLIYIIFCVGNRKASCYLLQQEKLLEQT